MVFAMQHLLEETMQCVNDRVARDRDTRRRWGQRRARVGPDGSTHTPQIATLTAANPPRDDQFGYSVDVAGDTIVVGVPFAGMGGDKRGAAHVFTANRDGTVTQTAILNSPEPANEEYFGASVAMSADTIVIGAPRRHKQSWAVYLYEKPASGWGDATKTATLTASTPPRQPGSATRSEYPGTASSPAP